MTTRFKHVWNRPVTPEEIAPSGVDIGEIKTLGDLRRRDAEMSYRDFVDSYVDEEVADSESFFEVGCNKLRCFYWTITDSGHSKKNPFTVTFGHNSAEIVDSCG